MYRKQLYVFKCEKISNNKKLEYGTVLIMRKVKVRSLYGDIKSINSSKSSENHRTKVRNQLKSLISKNGSTQLHHRRRKVRVRSLYGGIKSINSNKSSENHRMMVRNQ